MTQAVLLENKARRGTSGSCDPYCERKASRTSFLYSLAGSLRAPLGKVQVALEELLQRAGTDLKKKLRTIKKHIHSHPLAFTQGVKGPGLGLP